MKILYTVIFLILSKFCFGQVEILNLILTKPDTNIIYIGVDNPLEIKAPKHLNSLALVSNNLKINYRKKDKLFIASSSGNPNEIDTIKIYNKNQLIAQKLYRIEKICDPELNFGLNTSYELSINQIIDDPQFYINFPCAFNKKAFVARFDCIIVDVKGDTIKYEQIESNKLLTEQIETIKTLKTDSKILFYNVVGWGPAFCPRSFNPINITIK